MSRKLAGFTSPYLPPELIWACGLDPVRLRPGRSLAAADGYLPRNFAIDSRALLAAALARERAVDVAIFLDEDDTSRRLFDVWRAYAPIPCTDLVPLPRLDTPLARDRYAGALAALAAELSALSGKTLTAPALAQAVALYNEQRALWRLLRSCWLGGALGAADWYDLRWETLTGEPEPANAALRAAVPEARDPPPTGEQAGGSPDPIEHRAPRLLVMGAMEVPRPFLAFLESSGARVVAEDSDADERVLTDPVAEPKTPGGSGDLSTALLGLARAYLGKPPGPRPAELSRRLEGIARLIDERRVHGVIAVYPKFADVYLTEFVTLGELFRQRGIPALLLEDDGESGFSGQQRTRVEAFLEVIA